MKFNGGRDNLLIVVLAGFLLLIAIIYAYGDAAQWVVRADGYNTFAIVKEYGMAEWSDLPSRQDRYEKRICNEVPSESDARFIANALNQRETR